jgi:hypothetical protein
MGNCYALLGIAPTADTEEIEEAYQKKKKEFGADVSKQRELDGAYNEAIMATFAPIRAFSSPLPPLSTGKKSPQSAKPMPDQPQASVHVPPTQLKPQPPPQTPAQPTFQSTYTGPYTGVSVDEGVRQLVEEAPVSLTDEQLLSMNISEIREFMHDDNEKLGLLSLGIENKLLRSYAWTFITMAVFDIAMRFYAGPGWLTLTLVEDPDLIPVTPAFLTIAFAFASVAYCFACSLPMPFAARFFILGQPPDKSYVMWVLFFIAIASAYMLRWLTGRFLPLDVAGSAVSFSIIAMALSLSTLRYAGD